MDTNQSYIIQHLNPLERREQMLHHFRALEEDGSITQDVAIQLYDAAIKVMGQNWDRTRRSA